MEDQGVIQARDVDWYFDVVSPYAWLQYRFIAEHPIRARIQPRPILLAALLDHHGQLGPAEIPTKRDHTYRHVLWLAARHGHPLQFPHQHPFNPLPLLRLIVAADCDWQVIDAAFRFVWEDGRVPQDEQEMTELMERLDLDASRLVAPEIKAQLREQTDRAIERGVFGVPTLAVANRLFWGFDATRMCLDWLRDPNGFAGWEAGLDEITPGAERPGARRD